MTEVMEKPAAAQPPATAARSPLVGLRNEIDRVFDEFTRGMFRLPWPGLPDLAAFPARDAGPGMMPKCEVVEDDGAYRFTLELPGVDEKAVKVAVEDGQLTVEAESRQEKTEKAGTYHLSERAYGTYWRSFRLPRDVDAGGIGARMANGVLSIVAPKLPEAQRQARRIEIAAG